MHSLKPQLLGSSITGHSTTALQFLSQAATQQHCWAAPLQPPSAAAVRGAAGYLSRAPFSLEDQDQRLHQQWFSITMCSIGRHKLSQQAQSSCVGMCLMFWSLSSFEGPFRFLTWQVMPWMATGFTGKRPKQHLVGKVQWHHPGNNDYVHYTGPCHSNHWL